MNEKGDELKSFKLFYRKNKAVIIPTGIIIASLLIFFQFVIPQYKAFLSAKEEAKELAKQVETLKANLNILAGTNESVLDSQLQILNSALPAEKDFDGILNSIYYASQKAGVSPGAFSLQIGDLSAAQSGAQSPTINLTLPINGGGSAVAKFVEILSNTFPLSDVSLVKIGDKISTVNLAFYYKPLGSSAGIDAPIKPISQEELSIIDKLSGFENSK